MPVGRLNSACQSLPFAVRSRQQGAVDSDTRIIRKSTTHGALELIGSAIFTVFHRSASRATPMESFALHHYLSFHIPVIASGYDSQRRNSSEMDVGVDIRITMSAVRCPYCVLDDEFRQMISILNGRFVCSKCGHSAIPSDESFKCSCWRCLELRELQLRRCG